MAITSPVHGCRVSEVGVKKSVCEGVGGGEEVEQEGGGGSWVLRIHPDHRVNPLTE